MSENSARVAFESIFPVPVGLMFIGGSYSSVHLYNDADEYARHALTLAEYNVAWIAWQASRRAALSEAPAPSAIEATAALIANGLVGQASEEDVREVERLILELLGRGM
jgi:predicted nucleic acid-binding protein